MQENERSLSSSVHNVIAVSAVVTVLTAAMAMACTQNVDELTEDAVATQIQQPFNRDSLIEPLAAGLAANLTKLARPSVVKITTNTGIGSGWIYGVKGDTALILTNEHVVTGNPSFVEVSFDDGSRPFRARSSKHAPLMTSQSSKPVAIPITRLFL